MLLKVALSVFVCLGPASFVMGESCTGPQTLDFRAKSHPDAATYAELGKWFGDHRQYPCAIEAIRSGLALAPNSPELSYLLGLSLSLSGDQKGAIAPLEQAIQGAPKKIEPHLALAAALEVLHLRGKAKTEYEAALRIDPRSAMALVGLSKLFFSEGNYGAVINLLRSAPLNETLTLNLVQAYGKTGMLSQAVQLLEPALRRDPSSLGLTKALATVYVNQTRYQDAAELAKKSLQLHPNNIEAQDLYLHLLVLNHEQDAAQKLATTLLATHSHDFEVLYLNGVLEREEGRYDIARRHLEEAIALNPDHFNSRYNLGIVLAELNDPAGAEEQLEKALALGAGGYEPQVRYRLVSVLRTLGKEEQADEQASLTAQQIQARFDNSLAHARSEEAELALKTRDPQKAVALYRQAVEAAPGDALLNFKLAMALDGTNDIAAEQAALQQTVKIDPAFALAHNQIGYLASRNGDFAHAEEHFRLAVQAAPGYSDAWLGLAATLGMESRFAEALDAANNAVKADPRNCQAVELQQALRNAPARH
jgi:tetratricopeptide (TPR) repeat protein